MTPSEAWSIISSNLAHLYKLRRDDNYKGYVDADTEAEVIAFKALQLMQPKRVTHEASIRTACTCPECKNIVDEFTNILGTRNRVIYRNCRICGQTLDWSGEIDALPVHWIKHGEADYECSNCGFRFTSPDPIEAFPYCRCGCKMYFGD